MARDGACCPGALQLSEGLGPQANGSGLQLLAPGPETSPSHLQIPPWSLSEENTLIPAQLACCPGRRQRLSGVSSGLDMESVDWLGFLLVTLDCNVTMLGESPRPSWLCLPAALGSDLSEAPSPVPVFP